MTPADYLERVRSLIAEGRDEVALAVARQYGQSMLPLLTYEEFQQACALPEGAQMVVDL